MFTGISSFFLNLEQKITLVEGLAAVRALAKRYAEVDRHMPFVASIAITPIAKG